MFLPRLKKKVCVPFPVRLLSSPFYSLFLNKRIIFCVTGLGRKSSGCQSDLKVIPVTIEMTEFQPLYFNLLTSVMRLFILLLVAKQELIENFRVLQSLKVGLTTCTEPNKEEVDRTGQSSSKHLQPVNVGGQYFGEAKTSVTCVTRTQEDVEK